MPPTPVSVGMLFPLKPNVQSTAPLPSSTVIALLGMTKSRVIAKAPLGPPIGPVKK
jgi:hypothetical protein